jgi:FkbM family methyltransferase
VRLKESMTGFKNRLKIALRSRSLAFARDFSVSVPRGAEELAQVRWVRGDGRKIFYRRGTADAELVYHILLKGGSKGEYWLPDGIEPRVIFDIGANIGLTARYLAWRFPRAELHCFEPIPANVDVLRRNLDGLRVHIHPFGLGSSDGRFFFRIPGASDVNRGAYTRYGKEGTREVEAEIRAAGRVLEELGNPVIDVLKIDAEGSEYDILASVPRDAVERISWIYGEMHGDLEGASSGFKALDLLSPWFDIDVHKRLRQRNWFFDACNRRIVERFRRFSRAS